VAAQDWFDLAKYREMRTNQPDTLELVLGAMYEAVFYAQGSVGTPVICETPIPLSGMRLVALVDEEIANPSNPMRPEYTDADHLAFVLVNALKTEGACR
jgi:hypothetical protein